MNARVEDFLAHYGVVGMRWGKRKLRPVVVPHEDHAQARNALKKPIHQVSTADLNKAAQRLAAEKKFSDIKKQKTVISRGNKIIAGFLAAAGTGVALYNLAKSPAGKAAIKLGADVVGDILGGNGKHSTNYVAPVVKAAARHL